MSTERLIRLIETLDHPIASCDKHLHDGVGVAPASEGGVVKHNLVPEVGLVSHALVQILILSVLALWMTVTP